MIDIVEELRQHPTTLAHGAADEIERLRAMWQPAPRGGMTSDWQYWSLVYQRRLRKLKKLIAAQGYDIVSDEDGMPTALERNKP
jgi:hypothetical protein